MGVLSNWLAQRSVKPWLRCEGSSPSTPTKHPYYQTLKLKKKRLLVDGLKENKCDICKITEWKSDINAVRPYRREIT